MTGSIYFGQYNMRTPLYLRAKYNDTGSIDDYLFEMSSSYDQPYNAIETIYFYREDSGSYFNIVTGSYKQEYKYNNKKLPTRSKFYYKKRFQKSYATRQYNLKYFFQ